jgi:hypothetical protein
MIITTIAIAGLLLTGCGPQLEDEKNYEKRSAQANLFCNNEMRGQNYDQNWYGGCVTGFIGHCSVAACSELKD